jgi:ankyrin repeat protein
VRATEIDAKNRFSMVELNTSFILSAPTEENFHRAIEEVCATTPPLRDGNENTLESTGFRTVFERQIQRLFQNTHTSSDRRRVQNSRDIIAFTRDANRKLRINELLHLLALRSSTGEFSDTALEDPQDLLLITQGLIKIDTNDLVHFVHPWLQLYLQNDAAFPDAHQRLAELCIKYLRWPRFSHGPCDSMADIRKIISRAPFWVYAIENLHKHYTSACQRKDQAQLRRSIQAFLRHQSAVTCAQQLIRFFGEEVVDRQHVAELVRETFGDVHPAFVGDNSIAKWLDDHDLYWCSSETTTSLHLAILLQLDTFALELLDATGSILLNATNGLGETPLHLAVVHSCEALVDRLVLHTRDLNACDRRGMSPWHVAAACGSSTAVITLRRSAGRLDFNARVQPIEHRRSAKTTRPSRISPRISSTWNDRELSGSTALHLAARNGHLEIVKQITADTRCDSTIEDDDGMTPFHKACKYGRLEIVEHLIAQGWCPEQQSRKDGRTGLHLACKYKSGFEVARFILQSHPGLCNVKDINHETALHHAAAGLDSRAVRLLLSHPSIDVNPRNLKGQTPVVLAAFTPNDGFEMFTEHEALDRTVRIRSSSLAELAQKWTTIADNRLTADNQTISSGGRLHYRRNARLEYLAKDLSEHGPRLATPEVRTASWTSLSTV